MRYTNISKFLIKTTILFIFFIVTANYTFSQKREDVEMPKIIGSIKSITNLKMWARNDIGKWKECNFLPHEQISKICLATIRYEREQYKCLVVFENTCYSKYNIVHNEYCAYLWLFDSTKNQDLSDLDTLKKEKELASDTNVQTRLCQSVMISKIIGYNKPVTWDVVLYQMKKCFIGSYGGLNEYDSVKHKEELENKDPKEMDTYGKFYLKYRYDYKLNMAQFYLGDLQDGPYTYPESVQFDFDDSFLITDENCKDGNKNLNCRYLEVSKNIFDNFFKTILK